MSQYKALRSCASNIDSFLRRTIEEDDPILTPYVRGHLTNKLHPVLNLLSTLQGVSEAGAVPKQGGDENRDSPIKNSENPNTPKTNQGNDTNPIKNLVNEQGAEKPADDVQKHETKWFRRMNIAKEAAERDAALLLESRRSPDHQILAEHVKKLLMGYILEVAKLDIEVVALLNSTPEYSVEKPTSDLKNRRFGKIGRKERNVAYPSKQGNNSVKKMFFLRDKHLYRTQTLKKILDLINKTSGNTVPVFMINCLIFKFL
ncbi:hypothetical protein L1887_17840 [Cichorium endivia]|nr:hypothetical protein L1887_17840 [Cichorium endivia]